MPAGYQPVTGGFASRDTIGLYPRDTTNANRYAYAAGDPLTRTDPTGHCMWCISAPWETGVYGGAVVAGAPGLPALPPIHLVPPWVLFPNLWGQLTDWWSGPPVATAAAATSDVNLGITAEEMAQMRALAQANAGTVDLPTGGTSRPWPWCPAQAGPETWPAEARRRPDGAAAQGPRQGRGGRGPPA